MWRARRQFTTRDRQKQDAFVELALKLYTTAYLSRQTLNAFELIQSRWSVCSKQRGRRCITNAAKLLKRRTVNARSSSKVFEMLAETNESNENDAARDAYVYTCRYGRGRVWTPFYINLLLVLTCFKSIRKCKHKLWTWVVFNVFVFNMFRF